MTTAPERTRRAAAFVPTLVLAASAALAPASAAVAADADPERGRLLAQTCIGCHGVHGMNTTYPAYRVPKIGGQHADYIVLALQAYKQGLRSHKTMQAQAGSLTDQDMADLGAYFESAPNGE